MPPYIEIIQPDQAEGRLKEIYKDLEKKRGKLAEVHKIQSLNPESIVRHMDLYMTIMFGKSPLSRAQREMMAVVVSSVNRCPYCIQHHREALLRYWKDEERADKLQQNFEDAELDETDLLLCQFAQLLTEEPYRIDDESTIQPLKEAGMSDRAILDATLVISYFNFVNRIVLGLGVEHSPEEIKGYNY